jgi:hypothetical protein
MFGAKVKMDLPRLSPEVVAAVLSAMQDAEKVLPGRSGADKREWVKIKVAEVTKKIDLGSIPSWLHEPVRDAVVFVIIEVLWNVVIKKAA